MKTRIIALALLASAIAVPAAADTIDFGQFASSSFGLLLPLNGVTSDGVPFLLSAELTISKFAHIDNQDNFINYANGDGFPRDWFPLHTFVLGTNPGFVSIEFARPISSITGLSVVSTRFGPFTASLHAYSYFTDLGEISYSGVATRNGNVGQSFSFSAPGIAQIVLRTTNDDSGVLLGGVPNSVMPPPPPVGGVPEPATWLMLITGFGLVGLTMRQSGRRRRLQTVAA